jgi:hypothetical protein
VPLLTKDIVNGEVLEEIASGKRVVLPGKESLWSTLLVDKLHGKLEILFPAVIPANHLVISSLLSYRLDTYITDTE